MFEVGGVIDLSRQTLRIAEPNVTIAGQTAPSPGITLIQRRYRRRDARRRCSSTFACAPAKRVSPKPRTAGTGVRTPSRRQAGAHDVIVDHCTFTWATDENLSASGPRFTGTTPDEWRARHVAPHHVQPQHHRRGARDFDAPEVRALEGLVDSRQRHGHPDLRQSLRAQLRAQPVVQGRRARHDREQLHLQSRHARRALQLATARMGRRAVRERADDGRGQRRCAPVRPRTPTWRS